uniref:Uncharacterized protein n=1 Tax=Chelonoidis abingdonii TaxID=106734 RepID=A0A8C0G7A9_CHEAB
MAWSSYRRLPSRPASPPDTSGSFSSSSLGEEPASLRQQKLELQRRIFEKKQRRKRQEPLMVQANPDAKMTGRRGRRPEERIPLMESCSDHSLCNGERCPPVPTHVTSSPRVSALAPPTPNCSMAERPLSHPMGRGLSAGGGAGATGGDGLSLPAGTSNPFLVESVPEAHRPTDAWGSSVHLDRGPRAGGEAAGNGVGRSLVQGQSPVGPPPAPPAQSLSEAPGTPQPPRPEELQGFVLRPAPPGVTIQCRISRDRKGVDKGVFPFYYLHLERDDGRKLFLMSGRKRKKSKTSNYLISLDPIDLSRDGDSFIGKVRSNVLGTRFTVFDNGTNPDKKPFVPETAPIRQELATICYETNVLGFRGPRKMTVIIPGMNTDNERISIRPKNVRLLGNAGWGTGGKREPVTPVQNPDSRSLSGFILVPYIVLQLAVVAPDVFTMDYRGPVACSLRICLSAFDGIACECPAPPYDSDV